MARRYHTSNPGTGRLASWWPVLLSLLVVLVPTVCVLWFMTEAVENRRTVLRRSLADADFAIARERLETYWRDQAAALERAFDQSDSAPEFFQHCVESRLADSIVCFDSNGQLVYPAPARSPAVPSVEIRMDWDRIAKLEYEQNRFDEAAAAYAEIVASFGDPRAVSFDANIAAQALLAEARCLAKAGQTDQAISLLTETLAKEPYGQAVDPGGRLIAASSELRALELLDDPTDSRFLPVAQRLGGRLRDYGDPAMAASQRVFLMRELRNLVAARMNRSPAFSRELTDSLTRATEFPTLKAEELAADFNEVNPVPSKENAVRMTQSEGVWQLAIPERQLVALYRTPGVASRSNEAIMMRELPSGAQVKLIAPNEASPSETMVSTSEAGTYLPGWRLEHVAGSDELEPIADPTTAAYFWTGILVIVTMSIFAAIIARAFRRQMRLTRLKNDLVATVSHELKTPLASIRLLVDTLLDEAQFDEQRVREYLGLVAKENMRLSRLIDNFLAFSRMERNKHTFEFADVRVTDVIHEVAEVTRERTAGSDCELTVDVEHGLPIVEADADALATVLLNLLDNAFKYSGSHAKIILRAYADNGNVCLEVKDNGVGLTKGAARRVFRRFYQVDRRVSRETGGVGLGLSIVEFIVRAHDGTVRVDSRPGEGSTFTVAIPSNGASSTTEKGVSG